MKEMRNKKKEKEQNTERAQQPKAKQWTTTKTIAISDVYVFTCNRACTMNDSCTLYK